MAQRPPFQPLSWVGAGFVGGWVFLVVELALLPTVEHVPSSWFMRLLAAFVAGPVTLTWPAAQNAAIVLDGLVPHFVLSLGFAYLLCRVQDELSLPGAVLASLLLGFAIYLVDFYLLAPVFPWFTTVRGGVTIAAHLAYALTTVLVHRGLSGLAMIPVEPRASASA